MIRRPPRSTRTDTLFSLHDALPIFRAFQDSVHDLQVDFPIKLVIYKLFDRVVVGRMSEVFSGANHLLAGHGVEPKESATAPKRNPAAAAFAGSEPTHPKSPERQRVL